MIASAAFSTARARAPASARVPLSASATTSPSAEERSAAHLRAEPAIAACRRALATRCAFRAARRRRHAAMPAARASRSAQDSWRLFGVGRPPSAASLPRARLPPRAPKMLIHIVPRARIRERRLGLPRNLAASRANRSLSYLLPAPAARTSPRRTLDPRRLPPSAVQRHAVTSTSGTSHTSAASTPSSPSSPGPQAPLGGARAAARGRDPGSWASRLAR